jgi:hypothetical protein
MRRFPFVAACVLLADLLLAGPAAAEWGSRPGTVGLALGTGVSVFLPYFVPLQDVSAELVFADHVAIGAKSLFALGEPGEVFFVPFVAVGSARSRPSAAYVAAAWLPGTGAATLGLGYEAALPGPVRLYGEIGAVAAFGGSVGIGLPYGHLGVRLRF